jgi:hypothetical protein
MCQLQAKEGSDWHNNLREVEAENLLTATLGRSM